MNKIGQTTKKFVLLDNSDTMISGKYTKIYFDGVKYSINMLATGKVIAFLKNIVNFTIVNETKLKNGQLKQKCTKLVEKSIPVNIEETKIF